MSKIEEALTFADVSLVPAYSEILPHEVSPATSLGRGIELKVPFMSAAMDTITEAKTAISMAQNGGLGVVHKNLLPDEQAACVARVKKFEAGVVRAPMTLPPDAKVQDALDRMEEFGISSFPVMDGPKVIGLVTRRDLRFSVGTTPIAEVMSTDLVTAKENIGRYEAMSLLHGRRIEKLLLVDDDMGLKGLMTLTDLRKTEEFPSAARDGRGRLLCAAAVGPGSDLEERAAALVEAGVDVLVVDTAHGHSKGVIDAVKMLRKEYPDVCLVGGNIATGDAAEALAKAGVDAVKVGIGPGSICTTRMVAGVGVPQVSAILNVAQKARGMGIRTIADGGIQYSGDCVKALVAGADVIMVGSLFAGTEEAPGEVVLLDGRSFKVYRGMGSLGAMEAGSKDRYGQAGVRETRKLVPEGIEGRVPYRGPLASTLYQLVGGVRSGMGYVGATTLAEMRERGKFVKVTAAGLRESHVHDVIITREAPNYGR
ncbi:MAG: IMP dehydrogenase [Deltaproteobacteria bacterium]|nr:IMP dehydrogenase [Deltaproteobacteria bacterium]